MTCKAQECGCSCHCSLEPVFTAETDRQTDRERHKGDREMKRKRGGGREEGKVLDREREHIQSPTISLTHS